jgi:hypothetical protein
MKTGKKWMCALAAALGCATPAAGLAEDIFEGVAEQHSALVEKASANRWEAPAPPQPMPEAGAPVPIAPAAPCSIGDGGCDSCCTPGFQWIGSVEATYFWPQFNRSFLRNTLTNDLGTQTIVSNSASGSTDGSFIAAPRVTAGLQGDRWGLVGRYWFASTWQSGFLPAIPGGASQGLIGFDGFRAYTVDLEVQRRFCCCNWDMYGFMGARYAAVNNDRVLTSTNSFNGPDLSTTSYASQQFFGAGLTFGVYGMRPIWCDDSPVKLFFANRYSVLWGNGGAAAQTSATSIDTLNSLTSTNGAAAKGPGDLFIAELQLGLQWDACLRCLPGRVFVRSALEYQYWDTNRGGQASANSFVQGGGIAATSEASVGTMLFDLIGFNIGAGIMY